MRKRRERERGVLRRRLSPRGRRGLLKRERRKSEKRRRRGGEEGKRMIRNPARTGSRGNDEAAGELLSHGGCTRENPVKTRYDEICSP